MKRACCFFLSGIALLISVVAVPDVGTATTLLKADVPTLRQLSESVVHARTVAIESEWDADRRMIYSYVTLSVIETLHGKPVNQVVVRVPGGTIDGYTVKMDGAPEFQPGEIVVVFLSNWQDGTPKVTGYIQGLSRVVRDSLGNPVLQGGAADGRTISQLARQLRENGDGQ